MGKCGPSELMRRLWAVAVAGLLGMAGCCAEEQLWAGEQTRGLELYARALKMAKGGNYLEAIRTFRELEREQPHLPGLHYNMGNVLRHMGDHAEAIKAYRRAIELDPGDFDAYFNLAMTYSVIDEMELAMAALEDVVRLKPEDSEAHYLLSRGYYTAGNWKEAQAHLLRAKELGYQVPPQLEKALEARLRGGGNP